MDGINNIKIASLTFMGIRYIKYAINKHQQTKTNFIFSDSDEAIEKKMRREVRDTDSEMSDFQVDVVLKKDYDD